MNAIVSVEHIVTVDHVVKRFGKTRVLEDVSFALPERGVSVLLGANGEGKSTLLRLLLGLLKADAGELRVLGLDPIRDGRALRTEVAYVPDQPDNPAWMTPRELFRFLRPQYPRWNQERAERLAKDWEVPLERTFKQLSRGQAARALLAAALAQSPRLLLLDECFAGLDPLARRDLLGGFLAELAEHEVATLLVTHDLDVAARVAERVLVLAGGRITTQGSVAEVLQTDEEAARLSTRMLGLLERAQDEKEEAAA
ncbi:MAG: ABC transporter ATP-binding protein [Planctomycetes bacterium]|nr:ABC transporter ATP-binding protein [Planctomycetota bacterium]